MTVIDDREAYASRERFPEAKEVIAEDFEQAMARLAPNESSYIVIVTRGHRDDMRVLRWAVQTQARYIGMIGSKRKTITIFRELTKEGIPAQLFERVHAPVGSGYWSDYAGRDCGGDHGGADRGPPALGASFAAHELVQEPQDRAGHGRCCSRGSGRKRKPSLISNFRWVRPRNRIGN